MNNVEIAISYGSKLHDDVLSESVVEEHFSKKYENLKAAKK